MNSFLRLTSIWTVSIENEIVFFFVVAVVVVFFFVVAVVVVVVIFFFNQRTLHHHCHAKSLPNELCISVTLTAFFSIVMINNSFSD